jgi:hypothetical protein
MDALTVATKPRGRFGVTRKARFAVCPEDEARPGGTRMRRTGRFSQHLREPVVTGTAWGRSELSSGLVASPSGKPSSRAQCRAIAAEFWAQSESPPVRRGCAGRRPPIRAALTGRIVHCQDTRFRGNLTDPRNGPPDLSLRPTPPGGHLPREARPLRARRRGPDYGVRVRRSGLDGESPAFIPAKRRHPGSSAAHRIVSSRRSSAPVRAPAHCRGSPETGGAAQLRPTIRLLSRKFRGSLRLPLR